MGEGEMRRRTWLATCFALTWCITAGCGVPASTDGAGGVATLGPRPVNGDSSDAGDSADSPETSDVGDGIPQEVSSNGADSPAGDGDEDDTGESGDGEDDDTEGGDGENEDGDDDANGINTCAAISGRPFFAPNASLSFVEGAFIWTFTEVQTIQYTGIVECSGLDITGLTAGGDVFTGSYDPLNDTVFWEGLIYRHRSGGTD